MKSSLIAHIEKELMSNVLETQATFYDTGH